ncbi:MAG: PEP/pyruvate-binding domain-containing protein [Acidobacteriota bacterium]
MFWQRLREVLGMESNRRRPPSISERFSLFREIGSANDEFLRRLAEMMEDGAAGRRMGTTRAIYESLSAPIGTMVRALASMSGGGYPDLLVRHETLDGEFRAELLKEQAQETGPLVVTPDHPDALRPDLVGPKAARLAEVMTRAGLHVPPFFAVTVSGYRRFMNGTGLQNLVAATIWSTDLRDRRQLRDACEKCRSAIEAARLPVDLEENMRQAFRALREKHPGKYGVAVRSSATVEDSESSFAGQFESVLNVTEEGLAQAYKQVVASKYRFEALQYAVARGFLDDDVAMPVMVMAMVQPTAAGVAYSRDAEHPDCRVVTAVRGLAQPLVDGRAIPDRFVVSRSTPAEIVEMLLGPQTLQLRCAQDGGIEEMSQEEPGPGTASIEPEVARRIAHVAGGLERHFGEPQDIEWALDENGDLMIVQTRPLHTAAAEAEGSEEARALIEGYRVLARAAIRASGGTACGQVHRVADPTAVVDVPNDSVLVVPHTSPRLAGFMGSIRAIVAATGSPTGHMATVAREFGVPCLVGIETSLSSLQEGMVVTVDAWSKVVYEGEVPEVLQSPAARSGHTGARRDPLRESAERLLSRVAPLTLTDPESPEFVPANCQTLHDFARFVHQRAMIEMFEVQSLSARERRHARRLAWKVPMEVVLLDLGGGVEQDGGFRVPIEKVVSVPLCALIEGMTDPRLRWAGPVGFDLKGFMSVVVRSAADDQRYGEPSYAICSKDYVHFSSRLAYHFATVDSVCGASVNENYARFLFYGGAAISARREWRAHFLAKVLQSNGFNVKLTGDRVEAVLAKRAADVLEETLVMLGRLMVASRHLDMLMESSATAELFSRAFLSGDFGFETVRKLGP